MLPILYLRVISNLRLNLRFNFDDNVEPVNKPILHFDLISVNKYLNPFLILTSIKKALTYSSKLFMNNLEKHKENIFDVVLLLFLFKLYLHT